MCVTEICELYNCKYFWPISLQHFFSKHKSNADMGQFSISSKMSRSWKGHEMIWIKLLNYVFNQALFKWIHKLHNINENI